MAKLALSPRPARRLSGLAAVLLAGISLGAVNAHAQVLWNGISSNQWGDGNNWTPAAPPAAGETALFNGATPKSIDLNSLLIDIQAIQFDPHAAPGYTFNFLGISSMTLAGGIVNNGAPSATFNIGATSTLIFNGGTAADSVIDIVLGGRVTFNDGSAGLATFTNAGTIDFAGTSTASGADITNTGDMTFFASASAGGATIRNSGNIYFITLSTAGGAVISNGVAGYISFQNSSDAGTAFFNNAGQIEFYNDSTALNAQFVNNGNGSISFYENATAGNAQITLNDFSGAFFVDSATAANATITNNGGIVMFGAPLGTDAPTAGSATITNNIGGRTVFQAASTAANATITTNDASITEFFDNATGGNARFITNGTGIVDWSGTTGPGGSLIVTAGSIEGSGTYFIGGLNTLVVGSNNLSTEVSGVIRDFNPCGCPVNIGPGSLTKVGTGTLTLSGVNAFTGQTIVNDGALIVNGSIVTSSLLTVNSGATVGGTGILPTTVITAGGNLSPGNSIGTIQITGNLSFVGAGNYIVEVSPTAADRTNVSGTATLSGTVRAIFEPGAYTATSHVILRAAGGLNGTTFSGLVTTGAPALSAKLEYTNTDVLLTLSVAFNQVAGLNINQTAVANAVQNAFNTNGTLPPPFLTLAGLPGALLPGALTQLSGELGTGAASAAFQTMDQFLNVMLDPFLETRTGNGTATGPALSFAPQSSVQAALPAELLGYGPIVRKAPPMAVPFERRWTVWGAAYGGAGKFNGDTVIGSGNINIRNGSFAAGIDYRVSPDTVLGVAVAGGALRYDINGLVGSGSGDLVQAGLYGSTRFADNGYLSAALAYGRHDLSTERTVAFGGITDRLAANFDANSWGGRIEGGYRFAMAHFGITPYAAVQAQRFETPAYSERDLSGLNAFALNYAGRTTEDTRSEVGARFDYRTLIDTALLTLRARAAWAHEFSTERSINAVFQTLPGFGFTVIGAAAPRDVALVSAGAEVKWRNGVSLSAKFDGEFSGRSEVYAGSAALRVSW